MSKIIDIRPNPSFGRQFGDFSISGIFKSDKDKNVVLLDASGRNTISIAPEGMILMVDDDHPKHKEIYEAILGNAQLKALIGTEGNVGSNQRFYLHDQDVIDTKQEVSSKDKHTLRTEVFGLDDKKVVIFGRIFGLIGNSTNVRNSLIEIIDTNETKAQEILNYLMHEDRTIYEVIHGAVQLGDVNSKSGLYIEKGHYYFNGSVLTSEIDEVVAWLKKKDNAETYLFLKSKVFGEKKK